jgi:signal transduction histidine kinase
MPKGTPRPERGHTDDSLRTEREKTDRALDATQAAVEAEADAVIDRAREVADGVLADARAKAEGQLEDTGASPATRDAVSVEQQHEDAALQEERAAADRTLEQERAETRAALAKLLPLERTKTDRHLLTERARADHALANRDDFLGIVSHDLRNLLGGIVTSAGHLAAVTREGESASVVQAGTQRIQRYAARMNRLIGDLLDVAAIESGRLSIARVEGDVMAVVAEVVERFESDATAAGLSLEVPVAGPPLAAAFDHERLLQVMSNLIANAIKFTRPGGSIRIAGLRDRASVQVSITDTGEGIAPDRYAAVFERFWQAGANDRRGLGLGLYIAKSIVDAHGGTLDVESVPGEGSTFTVRLPAASVAPPAAA